MVHSLAKSVNFMSYEEYTCERALYFYDHTVRDLLQAGSAESYPFEQYFKEVMKD